MRRSILVGLIIAVIVGCGGEEPTAPTPQTGSISGTAVLEGMLTHDSILIRLFLTGQDSDTISIHPDPSGGYFAGGLPSAWYSMEADRTGFRSFTRDSILVEPGRTTVVDISLAKAVTWHVPSECPTIQAGIDSALAGDTVLVACGTYYDCTHPDPYGHVNCVIMKTGICLRSETGQADCVLIDAQRQGRCIFASSIDSTTSIEGFTLTGGGLYGLEPSDGGAGMYCEHSHLRVTNCVFLNNACLYSGGGIYCRFSSPTLENCTSRENGSCAVYLEASSPHMTDCILSENRDGAICCEFESSPVLSNCSVQSNSGPGLVCHSSSPTLVGCTLSRNAGVSGGGVLCVSGSSPSLTRCTFAGNSATDGGGFYCDTNCSPTLVNCVFYGNSASHAGGGIYCHRAARPTLRHTIVSFGTGGGAVYCDGGAILTLECCDIYGNAGGDWIGCIEDFLGLNGNISEDPLFCDAESDDFHLQQTSPCAPSGECGLIGAWPLGCDAR